MVLGAGRLIEGEDMVVTNVPRQCGLESLTLRDQM